MSSDTKAVHLAAEGNTGMALTNEDEVFATALEHYRAGRVTEAMRVCEAILTRDPRHAEASHLLGVAADAQGDPKRGVTLIAQALSLRETASFRSNHGMVLGHLGRHAEALDDYDRALELRPNYPEALNNRGVSLDALQRPFEAEQAYRRAVGLRPGYADAWANLGNTLRALGRPEEAVAACERALALRPEYPAALTNLGHALRDLDRLEASEAALRRALALAPTDVAAYNALAITLQGQNRPHEALAVLDLALGLEARDPETHHHRAMLLLRLGRLAEGWESYEWRFHTKQGRDNHVQFAARTPWRGERLDGRTILLVPEQGLGDTIQFVRYAALVAARGGRVVMGVQQPLVRLFAGVAGIGQLIGIGAALPIYDVHCPLLSLPRLFATTLATVPDAVPYLHAEPEAARSWAARLDTRGAGLRVGVVWAGNRRHLGDRQRSLPVAALEPLWGVPGVRWFSLQVGDNAADLAAIPPSRLPSGGIEDLAPKLTDFAETAAVIAGLDLVISADTSVAHLAGAMGRPVWVLMPATPDWRWLTTGDGSPWYPTMRLFRQDATRTWALVIERVASALRERANAG